MSTPALNFKEISWKQALLYAAVAGAAFNLAYSIPACSFLIAVYLWCLFQLAGAKSGRQAYYFGLLAGVFAYGPQTDFLWTIFGPAAIALLYILAFWVALFVALGRSANLRLGKVGGLIVIPFLWTGLEYFRSELYYLRFSWLNAGYVFSSNPQNVLTGIFGMYGIGFLLMAVVAGISMLSRKQMIITSAALLLFLASVTNLPNLKESPSIAGPTDGVRVAGVQLEAPTDLQVISSLNRLVKEHPDAQLLVLSEYTFMGPVPEKIKEWCRKNQRYLVVGAEDPVSSSNYYNTTFVIDPAGEFVFRQAKSVPIQFFKDGLAAKEQKLWESPWGKIGICICYDLSYSRVTDRLIELGAQALIVPTMDVMDWGRHQHELHARVAPIRAAEYGVPIFRMASSGISQNVDSTGRVLKTAPVAGDEAIIFGKLRMEPRGRLPVDRYLAPIAVGITGLVIAWLLFIRFRRSKPAQP